MFLQVVGVYWFLFSWPKIKSHVVVVFVLTVGDKLDGDEVDNNNNDDSSNNS